MQEAEQAQAEIAAVQLIAATQAEASNAAEALAVPVQPAAADSTDVTMDVDAPSTEGKSSKRKAEEEPVAESSKKARVEESVKLKRYAPLSPSASCET